MQKDTLLLIEEQTGLKLTLCDFFTGIRTVGSKKYFNVILAHRTSESKEFDTLNRFSKKSGLISVEPNGVKRIAVFPK